eukprot:943458-Rhodomonas_salina.1
MQRMLQSADTVIAYAARRCGTEIAYDARCYGTGILQMKKDAKEEMYQPPHAVCGTEIAYGATRWAEYGTEIAHGAGAIS